MANTHSVRATLLLRLLDITFILIPWHTMASLFIHPNHNTTTTLVCCHPKLITQSPTLDHHRQQHQQHHPSIHSLPYSSSGILAPDYASAVMFTFHRHPVNPFLQPPTSHNNNSNAITSRTTRASVAAHAESEEFNDNSIAHAPHSQSLQPVGERCAHHKMRRIISCAVAVYGGWWVGQGQLVAGSVGPFVRSFACHTTQYAVDGNSSDEGWQ